MVVLVILSWVYYCHWKVWVQNDPIVAGGAQQQQQQQQQGRFLRRQGASPMESTASSTTSRPPPEESQQEEEEVCGLYLAPSSLPKGGVGVYANRNFQAQDVIAVDAIVALVDLNFHACGNVMSLYAPWPTRNYAWAGSAIRTRQFAPNQGANIVEQEQEPPPPSRREGLLDWEWLSFGLGSMANSNVHLINVDEVETVLYNDESSSSSSSLSPALGSFTPYPERRFIAAAEIPQGSELFTFYGRDWHESRVGRTLFRRIQRYVSPQLRKDKAVRIAKLLANYFWQHTHHTPSLQEEEVTLSLVDTVMAVVGALDPLLQSVLEEKAATAAAAAAAAPVASSSLSEPPTSHLSAVANISALARQYTHSIRSPEWLEANGRCTDHIYGAAPSTIAGAGWGAFASRALPEGSIVATSPLLVIPNRSALLMYPHPQGAGLDEGNLCAAAVVFDNDNDDNDDDDNNNNNDDDDNDDAKNGTPQRRPVSEQLLVNYAFGHHETPILLVPLASGVAYMNHASGSSSSSSSSARPNVAVRWPNHGVLHHNASYLTATLDEMRQATRPVLALEYVALCPIGKDEEIFLDYGDAWQRAWEEHVRRRRHRQQQQDPPASSFFANDEVVRTMHEKEYPPNVYTKCRASFRLADSATAAVNTSTSMDDDDNDDDDDDAATRLWEFHHDNENDYNDYDEEEEEELFHPCQVLSRDWNSNNDDQGSSHVYTAYIANSPLDFTISTQWIELQQRHMGRVVTGIPRSAIVFRDKLYGSHHYHPDSFRHEMTLPHDMLPLSWKSSTLS